MEEQRTDEQVLNVVKILIGLDSHIEDTVKTVLLKKKSLKEIQEETTGLLHLRYSSVILTLQLGMQAVYRIGVNDGYTSAVLEIKKIIDEKQERA